MFGLGLIKGTIFGVSIGILTGLTLKEICKNKKSKTSVADSDVNKNSKN